MKTVRHQVGMFRPARSGQIIGAIVDALRLDDGVLTTRTARRFFQGRSISEDNRTEIFLAMGEALVKRELVPVPPVFRERGVSMPAIIAAAIARGASRWDSNVSRIQGRSAGKVDRSATTERLLRFVIIDLAVRVFALLRLAGLEPDRPGPPLWAQDNGGGRLLRELVARTGLTREELAEKLGGSTTSSVDNWLDGKVRPTNDSIYALSRVLADHIEDATSGELALKIQRQFTFAILADLVEPWIGREKVIELSTALVRFVWLITEDVRTMDRPPVDEAPEGELDALRFGTADGATCTLVQNLSVVEPDETWSEDLLAATVDWGVLFESVVAQTNPTRTSAGLAEEISDVLSTGPDQPGLGEPPKYDDPALDMVSDLASEASDDLRDFAEGRLLSLLSILEDGIESRRAIVRSFPNSPLAHSELGSFLGIVGKNLRRRDLVDEGVTECMIASELLPGWDLPAVEQGIILANVGAFDESLERLERVRETLSEETPHFCSAMGYVLMELDRYAEALEYLERVLEVRPDYAEASLHASHCAFMLGDHWGGQRYAKRARSLGNPEAFNAWRRGEYSSSRSR